MPYKDKEKQKEWYEAHRDEIKAYKRAYRDSHKEELQAYRDSHKEYWKEYHKAHSGEDKVYQKENTNLLGEPKKNIRSRSRRYLYNKLKHNKLKGYEIHHCFGYEDSKCFVYIPKELHIQIHQYLRDNNISVESNHYIKIAHLINDWDGYTYIKV